MYVLIMLHKDVTACEQAAAQSASINNERRIKADEWMVNLALECIENIYPALTNLSVRAHRTPSGWDYIYRALMVTKGGEKMKVSTTSTDPMIAAREIVDLIEKDRSFHKLAVRWPKDKPIPHHPVTFCQG